MDRDDGVTGLDQDVNDQPGRALNGDRQLGRRTEALEPEQQIRQASRIMADLERATIWPA
jgi:hypothetical protein